MGCTRAERVKEKYQSTVLVLSVGASEEKRTQPPVIWIENDLPACFPFGVTHLRFPCLRWGSLRARISIQVRLLRLSFDCQSRRWCFFFFFSLRPRRHPALPGRSAEECLYAAESRHTHTHILTQPPPPTDSVLLYRWNATDSRPWTVLAAAEARSAPGSARTRTAVLSPVGLTVRAALSFTRCHHTFMMR